MNPWRGLGDLPREVWVLFGATLINRMGTMVLPFLVLYLTERLGFRPDESGLVLACYGVGALVTGPLAGRLSDRFGPLPVMLSSLFLSGLVILIVPLATSILFVAAVVFLWSVVGEAFRPASLAIITNLVSASQRKAAFAVNRLAINLGMSVGPALGGFLFALSYESIFWVDGATTICAGAILAIAPWGARGAERSTAHAAGESGTQRRGVLPVNAYWDRRLLYFLASMIPVQIVFFQHEASMPLYLVQDLGLQATAYGFMFTVNTVLIILCEVPLNIAMERWPHGRTLSLGAVLVGAGFGGMALASGLPGVTVTVVVWTFGEMILLPGAANYVADIAPHQRRGEYMGLYQMTFSLSFAVSAWIGTGLLSVFGALVLWASMFGAGTLSSVLLRRVH